MKPNSMAPVESQKLQPKVQDYLMDRRKERQVQAGKTQSAPAVKWSPRDLSSIKIKKQAVAFDAELKRRELAVSEMNPNSLDAVKAKEEVSNYLIDDIRNRIALLSEVDN